MTVTLQKLTDLSDADISFGQWALLEKVSAPTGTGGLTADLRGFYHSYHGDPARVEFLIIGSNFINDGTSGEYFVVSPTSIDTGLPQLDARGERALHSFDGGATPGAGTYGATDAAMPLRAAGANIDETVTSGGLSFSMTVKQALRQVAAGNGTSATPHSLLCTLDIVYPKTGGDGIWHEISMLRFPVKTTSTSWDRPGGFYFGFSSTSSTLTNGDITIYWRRSV